MLTLSQENEQHFANIIESAKEELILNYQERWKDYSADAADMDFVFQKFYEEVIKKERNDFFRFTNNDDQQARDRFLEELLGYYDDAFKWHKEYPHCYFVNNQLVELKSRWLKTEYKNKYSQFNASIIENPEAIFERIGQMKAFDALYIDHVLHESDPINENDTNLGNTQSEIDTGNKSGKNKKYRYRINPTNKAKNLGVKLFLNLIPDTDKKPKFISTKQDVFKNVFTGNDTNEKVNWVADKALLVFFISYLIENEFIENHGCINRVICTNFLLDGKELVYETEKPILTSIKNHLKHGKYKIANKDKLIEKIQKSMG